MNKKYSKLFSPIKIKNFVFDNRFVLSPITLNVSSYDGFASKEDIDYALKRAHSAYLAISSAAYINLEGQIFEFGFSAANDEHIDSLKQVANAMKSKGAKAILQLAYSGRFSIISLNRLGYVVGPSKQSFMYPFPHEVQELSIKQIKELIKDYQKATLRAIEAGFDGVEISSAQKILIQAFFSVISNQRNDIYGNQNLENRSRLGLEILQAVRETIDKHASENFILGYRATAEETRGQEIGYPIEDFLQFMDQVLINIKIDYLALASWGRNIYKYKVQSQGEYFNQLVNKVVYQHINQRIPVIVSGGINSPDKCLEALEYGDMIGLSSVFVAEPDFVRKIKTMQIDKINLHITEKDIEKLAIPKAAFKEMVKLMDYGESLPKDTRDELKKLENNYSTKN
ncbi:MAG: NADH-dependent flavin oxidoreductase [Spiroplasma sp. WSS]|nr:MAG: NADH-dependent flavin oxidoreductase [Spiroplasma sp. WSS]